MEKDCTRISTSALLKHEVSSEITRLATSPFPSGPLYRLTLTTKYKIRSVRFQVLPNSFQGQRGMNLPSDSVSMARELPESLSLSAYNICKAVSARVRLACSSFSWDDRDSAPGAETELRPCPCSGQLSSSPPSSQSRIPSHRSLLFLHWATPPDMQRNVCGPQEGSQSSSSLVSPRPQSL